MGRLYTIFLFLTFSFRLTGQVYIQDAAAGRIPQAAKIWLAPSDSSLKYIEFREDKRIPKNEAIVQLKSVLQLPARSDLVRQGSFTDSQGMEHIRMQLTHSGIPVEGSVYILHCRGDELVSANGRLSIIGDIISSPVVTEQKALEIARDHIGAKTYLDNSLPGIPAKPELVILTENDTFYLAYKLDIFATDPISRNYVYVDGHSGIVRRTDDRIHADDQLGTAHTKYSGIQNIHTTYSGDSYLLVSVSRGVEIATLDLNNSTLYSSAVDFTDVDNYWDNTANQDDAATNAHFAFERALDYFLNTYSRNSFDNLGSSVRSYIHFSTDYNNAFWNGSFFTFGDGDGIQNTALTSLDIVAHEYTHAVTQYTAGLVYAYESGALNESFSDIFGVVIDYYSNPATANYTIGEELSIDGTALRSLEDPGLYDDPDTYRGNNWVSGVEDNGGVHTNCGVQNYWFYLLAEGGSGVNDLGNSYSVQGIGIEKAAAIAYRNLSVYLTPDAQYIDARFYSIQSAIDLFGSCSEEVIAVTNAWYAVGIGEKFSGKVRADFVASANFACELPALVNFQNFSENADEFTWYFGDGTESPDDNSQHLYHDPGIYDITLVARGKGMCEGSDTLTMKDMLLIDTTEYISVASCIPSVDLLQDAGITELMFGAIHSFSGTALKEGGYVDNSNRFRTPVRAGDEIHFTIITDGELDESASVWLDLDNDGAFSANEKLWGSVQAAGMHKGTLIVPAPSVYNISLRLRIGTDQGDYPVEDPCGPLHYGQFEDYRVVILENDTAPRAGFRASDTLVGTGEKLVLEDASLHMPDNFEWKMKGATPEAAFTRDREIVYSQPGTYSIALTAGNQFGTDSIIKEDIIEVLPAVSISLGSVTADLRKGLIYDTGGPEGEYSCNEDISLLIHPDCARSITIRFMECMLEDFHDFLFVYDGVDETSPLLAKISGNNHPEMLTAGSGSVFLRFISDGSGTAPGFKFFWEADLLPDLPLSVDFMVSDPFPAFLETIEFGDLSENNPISWLWDFGDGSYSSEQNPNHRYTDPGWKQVTLYASNCYHEANLTKTLFVAVPPLARVNPGGYNEYLKENGKGEYSLLLTNLQENATLVYDISVQEDAHLISSKTSKSYESEFSVSKEVDTFGHRSDVLQPEVFDPACKFQADYPDYSQPELEQVLFGIERSACKLLDLVTDPYLFDEGEQGTLIEDGGMDMYDGGNYLSTSACPGISYSNDSIRLHNAFGPGCRYFTSKQDGFFILAADIDGISAFSVTGNLGADGQGFVDAGIFEFSAGLQRYTGFVKRVYGADDPSVNHLIIVPNASPGITHTIDANSNSDGHFLTGLENDHRLYYLLFATEQGSYVEDSVIRMIMQTFIEITGPSCDWLKPEVKTGMISNTGSVEIALSASAENILPGSYSASIHVLTNDTLHREILIPFRLEVGTHAELSVDIPEYLGKIPVGTILTDTLCIRNTGFDELQIEEIMLDGDPFSYLLQGSSVAPGDSTGLIIRYNPVETGSDTAHLSILSNAANALSYSLVIVAEATDLTVLSQPAGAVTPGLVLKAYPNPVTDLLHVYISGYAHAITDLQIISASGRIVKMIRMPDLPDAKEFSLDLSDLTPGIYYLRISSGNSIQSIRFTRAQ